MESGSQNMESGSGGNRWKDVKEAMMAECVENRLEVQLVENLRKEAAIKCLAKVRQIADASYPKVCLQKLDVNRISQSQNSTTEEAAPVLEYTSPSSPLTEISPVDAASAKKFVTEISRPYFQKLATGSGYRCLKCKSILYGTAPNNRHLFALHPETLFTHLKLPNINDQEFKAYCKYAVKQESLEARQVKKCGKEAECIYCRQKFLQCQHLRYHVVMEHFKALEEKIISLQVDGISKWHCNACDSQFSSKGFLKRHKLLFHSSGSDRRKDDQVRSKMKYSSKSVNLQCSKTQIAKSWNEPKNVTQCEIQLEDEEMESFANEKMRPSYQIANHGNGISTEEEENVVIETDQPTESETHTKLEHWLPNDSNDHPREDEEMKGFATEMMGSEEENRLKLPVENNAIEILACGSYQQEESRRDSSNIFLDNEDDESPIQIKTEFVHESFQGN